MAGNPGWYEMDNMKFHHVTQNGTQYKIYELFISGISRLVLLDCGWLWVTGTMESKAVDKGGDAVLRSVLTQQKASLMLDY